MRVEHRVSEERTRTREPLVEPVVQLGGEPASLGSRLTAGEHDEQLLHVIVGHGLVERHDHPRVAFTAQVDATLGGGADYLFGGVPVELHAERVEVDVAREAVAELLQARRQRRGVPMDPPRDRRQSLGAVPDGVHARHHRE